MPDVKIMKAVEFAKLPVSFRKTHPDHASLEAAGYWLQMKYDGCFGLVQNGQMFSRTGEDYTRSCEHIVRACYDAFGPDYAVIGEVWHRRLDFHEISGLFRRHSPSPDLVFVVNDCVPRNDLNTAEPYRLRFERVQEATQKYGGGVLSYAVTWTGGNWPDNSAQETAQRLKALGGYDGAIIRDPEAGYTVGLVKQGEIVKVKPVVSLDLRVIDFNVEPGEKTGRPVVTITVEYKGKHTQVGSGIPHDFDGRAAVGQIAEVECMEVTAEGKLREPRFQGLRFDKEQAD